MSVNAARHDLLNQLSRHSSFVELARDLSPALTSCVRIFNPWAAGSPSAPPATWTQLAELAGAPRGVLGQPILTKDAFDWTRSQSAFDAVYYPPDEGQLDPVVRQELHSLLMDHSPDGVECAYWIASPALRSHLSTLGSTWQFDDELEYVVLPSDLHAIDSLAQSTDRYPEWMIERSLMWVIHVGKDNPFVELACSDHALTNNVLRLCAEAHLISSAPRTS